MDVKNVQNIVIDVNLKRNVLIAFQNIMLPQKINVQHVHQFVMNVMVLVRMTVLIVMMDITSQDLIENVSNVMKDVRNAQDQMIMNVQNVHQDSSWTKKAPEFFQEFKDVNVHDARKDVQNAQMLNNALHANQVIILQNIRIIKKALIVIVKHVNPDVPNVMEVPPNAVNVYRIIISVKNTTTMVKNLSNVQNVQTTARNVQVNQAQLNAQTV